MGFEIGQHFCLTGSMVMMALGVLSLLVGCYRVECILYMWLAKIARYGQQVIGVD